MKQGAAERRELWRQRISEQEASGQTIRAFCRERGLKESTFYAWRKCIRENSAASATTPAAPEPPLPSDGAVTYRETESTAPLRATEHPETRQTDPPSPVHRSPQSSAESPLSYRPGRYLQTTSYGVPPRCRANSARCDYCRWKDRRLRSSASTLASSSAHNSRPGRRGSSATLPRESSADTRVTQSTRAPPPAAATGANHRPPRRLAAPTSPPHTTAQCRRAPPPCAPNRCPAPGAHAGACAPNKRPPPIRAPDR